MDRKVGKRLEARNWITLKWIIKLSNLMLTVTFLVPLLSQCIELLRAFWLVQILLNLQWGLHPDKCKLKLS